MSLKTYKVIEFIGTAFATITLVVVIGGMSYAYFF
jgi:flavin-binding protein dodecin